MMAAADRFELVIHGRGGHAARPHAAIDPIVLAAAVVNAVQQIVSRKLNPMESGVITIGTIHGGTANNVIPDTVTMSGTIRSFTPESRELLRRELAQTVSLVEALGGSYEYTLYPGYPPTVNSPEAVDAFTSAASEILGSDHVLEANMIMGAEDFSYMAQAAPGCFIRLGVHDPAWDDAYYNVHRADFRMNEDALPIGSAVLAASAIQWMESQTGSIEIGRIQFSVPGIVEIDRRHEKHDEQVLLWTATPTGADRGDGCFDRLRCTRDPGPASGRRALANWRDQRLSDHRYRW